MNRQGWEDLRSEFKVTAMEWGVYRLKYASPTYYFVHTMWKQGKVVPPSLIGQRKATKFIREEQKKILRSDKIHDVILSYTQIESERNKKRSRR
jgi:hypothetical protein